MEQIIDEREKCMAGSFLPKKGTTDSIYTIEKCNQTFYKEL